MTADSLVLPAMLAAARNRFARWRSKRACRSERIPPALWKVAARCAVRFGIYRTARSLGLDYACLKRRVVPAGKPIQRSAEPFVELLPSVRLSQPECVVEVENRAGAKLRIELPGSAVPDVVELARRFGREEP